MHSKNKQKTDKSYKKWLLHPVGLICLSKKIPEPFSWLSAEDIKNPVTNVADALQQIAGIDVRRGLVVRKLIYIYGVEVWSDAATYRWILRWCSNWTSLDEFSITTELLRELKKRPASRVFGQNAFTGAEYTTKDSLIMMLHYVFRRVLMASLVLLLPRS
jgi:iron complex outermembrane receptor protein